MRIVRDTPEPHYLLIEDEFEVVHMVALQREFIDLSYPLQASTMFMQPRALCGSAVEGSRLCGPQDEVQLCVECCQVGESFAKG